MRTSLALLLFLAIGCRTVGPQALEDEEVRMELGRQVVATLDKQEHYFADPGTRAAFSSRLESIARVTHDAEGYYRELSSALATLNEGHTGLVGSATIPFSDTIPPVAIMEIPDGIVVAGVAPGVEAGLLRPGDLILSVGDEPVHEVLVRRVEETAGSTPHGRRARAVAHLLAGPTRTPAEVTVRDIDGNERVCFPLRFLLDDEGRYRQRFGFLPEQIRAQRADLATGYLALPDFEPGRAEEFFEALAPLRSLPILILDLRGNPGGRIQVLQRIAAAFFDEPTELLRMTQGARNETVSSTTAPFAYRGALRVLVDARTGSAAELLAAALQDTRGATVIGRTTAGSTRSRRTARLPGGVLFHYAGRAEFLRLDGRPVEGVGVRPDVNFRPTRESLAEGHFGDAPRDPAVQRALSLN
ncbi:MAG: S41 family peptidase [Planctomycetota bacterium]|jgi:C-terminal processing protease CtpA/Prc